MLRSTRVLIVCQETSFLDEKGSHTLAAPRTIPDFGGSTPFSHIPSIRLEIVLLPHKSVDDGI
jgi:hypothetical protein